MQNRLRGNDKMFKNNHFNLLKAGVFALLTVIITLIVRHYSQLLDYSYLNNKFEPIHSDCPPWTTACHAGECGPVL